MDCVIICAALLAPGCAAETQGWLLNRLQMRPISAYVQLSWVLLQVDGGAGRTRRSRLEPTAREGGRDLGAGGGEAAALR